MQLLFAEYFVDLLMKKATWKEQSPIIMVYDSTPSLSSVLTRLESHCDVKGQVDLFYMLWKNRFSEEHH